MTDASQAISRSSSLQLGRSLKTRFGTSSGIIGLVPIVEGCHGSAPPAKCSFNPGSRRQAWKSMKTLDAHARTPSRHLFASVEHGVCTSCGNYATRVIHMCDSSIERARNQGAAAPPRHQAF